MVIQTVEQVQEDDLQVDVDDQVAETMTRQAKALVEERIELMTTPG